MSSATYSALNTASTALSAGIIAAIVVGSVVGLALLIGFIICIYCLCCRKPKTYPGAVMSKQQQQQYPGAYNQPPSYPTPAYNDHSLNKV